MKYELLVEKVTQLTKFKFVVIFDVFLALTMSRYKYLKRG